MSQSISKFRDLSNRAIALKLMLTDQINQISEINPRTYERLSRGQGPKCSRPRTKDTSGKCSQKKKEKKVFKEIFQAISKKTFSKQHFSADRQKKRSSKIFFKRSTFVTKNSAVLDRVVVGLGFSGRVRFWVGLGPKVDKNLGLNLGLKRAFCHRCTKI